MKATFQNCQIKANCPDCDGALTTFEREYKGRELGFTHEDRRHDYGGVTYTRTIYSLFRCAGCGRGGLGKIHDTGNICGGVLESFFPTSREMAKIPAGVPLEIQAEYREAETCASVGARRAASALIRSALEKTLKKNGYTKRSLEANINDAADDGVITNARKQKAHDDVRVLGNDVLHDEWREVSEEEITSALHYTQRIFEDLYDDRVAVETILKKKKRIASPEKVDKQSEEGEK